MTSLTRAELGALGEQLAADHLRDLGLVDQLGALAHAVTADKVRRLRRLGALWIGRRRTPEITHLEAVG